MRRTLDRPAVASPCAVWRDRCRAGLAQPVVDVDLAESRAQFVGEGCTQKIVQLDRRFLDEPFSKGFNGSRLQVSRVQELG